MVMALLTNVVPRISFLAKHAKTAIELNVKLALQVSTQ